MTGRGKGPRGLSAEERALWDKVRRQATPIHPAKRNKAPKIDPVPADKRNPVPDTIPHFRIGARSAKPTRSTTADVAPPISEALGSGPVKMDRKAFTNLKRGKLRPEARIDLHGMTADRAHDALTRFILSKAYEGKRLVLVITGKGKSRDDGGPIPVRFGVLRHQVPQWLSLPPLAPVVLQVTTAHQRHGGEGAYYVYLRRTR